MELLAGIEPATSSLPRKCSTPELQQLVKKLKYKLILQTINLKKSGRPGSNRPPSAWKADALPNELLPLVKIGCQINLQLINYCKSLTLKRTKYILNLPILFPVLAN
jgi:hypothetical protein